MNACPDICLEWCSQEQVPSYFTFLYMQLSGPNEVYESLEALNLNSNIEAEGLYGLDMITDQEMFLLTERKQLQTPDTVTPRVSHNIYSVIQAVTRCCY